jgi:hypothetical protein
MFIPDPAVVQRAGGKVEWVKPKGPEHIVWEYWIFCWLGPQRLFKAKANLRPDRSVQPWSWLSGHHMATLCCGAQERRRISGEVFDRAGDNSH